MIKAIAITAADMVNASIIMIFTSHIVRREVYMETLIRQENVSIFLIVFLVLDQKMTNIIYINIINKL
jgi:hypothetical protein